MTSTYIDATDYTAADSPEQFAEDMGYVEDGDEFDLLHVQVVSKNRYRIIDGKPVQVASAFPTGGTER